MSAAWGRISSVTVPAVGLGLWSSIPGPNRLQPERGRTGADEVSPYNSQNKNAYSKRPANLHQPESHGCHHGTRMNCRHRRPGHPRSPQATGRARSRDGKRKITHEKPADVAVSNPPRFKIRPVSRPCRCRLLAGSRHAAVGFWPARTKVNRTSRKQTALATR